MNIEKHLILNKYLFNIFGFIDFKEVSELFKDIITTKNPDGSSIILGRVLGKPNMKVTHNELVEYDSIILEYEDKIKKARNNPKFELKYFQYFTILFTEYFFNKISSNKIELINNLNHFSQEYCDAENIDRLYFLDSDLRKLAYWMATGSGKTLLMHINLWQILKYFPNEWENIILITPNEGLSKQHYDEFRLSGIEAKLYNGSEESLKTKNGEVLIIEITKLTEEKKGEGVSIDVSYFSGSRNLILIDEGHKGQKSDEQKWKKLREELGRDGFIFEYSATFGQILSSQKALLLEEYSKAIIFDYSYYYFYKDGYGKDFYTFNIANKSEYSDNDVKMILTASLLSYYQQLIAFEKNKDLCKEFEIEEPLWIFVGSSVLGKINTKSDEETVSDILKIVSYLRMILLNPTSINTHINKILQGNSGLKDEKGEDIFKSRFEYIKDNSPGVEQIFKKVFNGTGNLELHEIKKTNDEIGLKTSLSQEYFGVINIGDVASFKKKVNAVHKDIEIKQDNIVDSLFESINKTDSKIKLLIGAKKFIEGWNSWRVSNMGLMNIGKGEGTQIIQLFGRGVRLKGKDQSLKRQENPDLELKILQTLSIYGLNADYMDSFLKNITPEVEQYIEFEIPINFNQEGNWKKSLYTIKKDENVNFKNEVIELEYESSIVKKITIDLQSKINIGQGLDIQRAAVTSNIQSLFSNLNMNLLNMDELQLKLNTFILARGYFNLIIKKNILHQILIGNEYKILLGEEQLPKDFTIKLRLMNIAEQLLKEYIYKFYSLKEKKFVTDNLTIDKVSDKKKSEIYNDGKIIVQVPKEDTAKISTIKALIQNINQFYTNNINEIPTIHFGNHLYSPVAIFNEHLEDIKTIPVKLNKGETKFIEDLRTYLIQNEQNLTKNSTEIFILRNISRKGLGFFLKGTTFFPDFIIWVKKKALQEIIFIDPKGIKINFPLDKIEFCNETIPEIEKRISNEFGKKKVNIRLKAFILSITPYEDIGDTIICQVYDSKEMLIENKVLFQEDGGKIFDIMFEGI